MKLIAIITFICVVGCIQIPFNTQQVRPGEIWEYCRHKTNPFEPVSCQHNLVLEVKKNSKGNYWVKYQIITGDLSGYLDTESQMMFLVGSKKVSGVAK